MLGEHVTLLLHLSLQLLEASGSFGLSLLASFRVFQFHSGSDCTLVTFFTFNQQGFQLITSFTMSFTDVVSLSGTLLSSGVTASAVYLLAVCSYSSFRFCIRLAAVLGTQEDLTFGDTHLVLGGQFAFPSATCLQDTGLVLLVVLATGFAFGFRLGRVVHLNLAHFLGGLHRRLGSRLLSSRLGSRLLSSRLLSSRLGSRLLSSRLSSRLLSSGGFLGRRFGSGGFLSSGFFRCGFLFHSHDCNSDWKFALS